CAAGTPDLYSFPRRRSSDLDVRGVGAKTREDGAEEVRGHRPASAKEDECPAPGDETQSDLQAARPVDADAGRIGRQPLANPLGRSEEHTSELQSRVELVCRL